MHLSQNYNYCLDNHKIESFLTNTLHFHFKKNCVFMLIMPHCNYCTAEIIFHGKLLQDFNEVSGTPGNGRLDVARNA